MLFEPGKLQRCGRHQRARKQRHQAHDRPDAYLHVVCASAQVGVIVVEAVNLVPQRLELRVDAGGIAEDRGDAHVVIQVVDREILVLRAARLKGQLDRDLEEVGGIHRHPGRGVGLIQGDVRGNTAAVQDADVVQSQETTLEDVVAFGVFTVHPPGEVDLQLGEHVGQKIQILGVRGLLALLEPAVYGKACPPRHGWVHVTEFPLVGRNLSIGMEVVGAQE